MRVASTPQPAPSDPVARVLVDVALAHLDRPFDYLVPAELASTARPGTRVRVRFAGRLADGYVLERRPASEHTGRLAFLERVTSPEVVLTPEIAALIRAVADHWGGVASDVLRLAIPPRHARVEAEPGDPASAPPTAPATTAGWAAYPSGLSFVSALTSGLSPRAVWTALPGEDWPARCAEVAHAAAAAGRGALLLVPDRRDLARLAAALRERLGDDFVALAADLGPAARYRAWLRISRGQVRVVAGTRAAAYAPVAALGLVVMWDDGDDLYAEPRAPYAHARDVLVLRAHRAGAAALLGAVSRSVEATSLVAGGWARQVTGRAGAVRDRMPRVRATGDDAAQTRDAAARSARLPTVAWEAAGRALAAGRPVLVQVPRRGYVPALACANCRTPARCATCGGPLGQRRAGPDLLACRWCARPATAWTCPVCEARRLRASVVGARRTAEELGRSFPGVVVRTSGRDAVLDTVPDEPALVVCTPGAEPVATNGYGAALLLDGWALLTRADLRAAEEALRRWLNAATLVRAGGAVVVAADGSVPAVQALVRWAPGWLAERERSERTELGFPPAARLAAVSGHPAGVADLLAVARLPGSAQLLGPVALDDVRERMLLRVPRGDGAALARALAEAQGVRSARKAPDPVRVQLDPMDLL